MEYSLKKFILTKKNLTFYQKKRLEILKELYKNYDHFPNCVDNNDAIKLMEDTFKAAYHKHLSHTKMPIPKTPPLEIIIGGINYKIEKPSFSMEDTIRAIKEKPNYPNQESTWLEMDFLKRIRISNAAKLRHLKNKTK